MAIDPAIKDQAEELYVLEGMTLEEVAEETLVPNGTIKRWSSENNWKVKRREFKDAESEIRRYSRLTRLKLIKDAMTSLDPQKVYAFARLEQVMQRPESLDSPIRSGNDDAGSDIEIKTPLDAINALQEAIELKLRVMLAKPETLNLSAIKDLKQAWGLVDEMKAKYGTEPEKETLKGLDENQARFWREKVLGVKQ